MRKGTMSLLAIALFLNGCTARNWYDGLQMQQRNECGKYPQQYEVQRCLEKTNAMTYDQYKNQREALQGKQ